MESPDAIKQSEQKIQDAANDEFENDRKEQLLMDALQGLKEADSCRHTPDSSDLIDWDYKGDEVMCLFRCRCGKTVTEVFKYFDTRISD